MPKEYFSVSNTTSIQGLSSGSKIHVIGVSGVAMAQMAVALAASGFEVSGSDKDFYEPMGSLLRASPVKLCTGFRAENIPADVKLVLIGNVVSYANLETDEVEAKGYPYTLFPRLLFELLISGRHSVVISGTHGKTTTSALLATTLYRLQLDPSYFIGGIARDLPMSLNVGTGSYSVVEGDEYDSAFFAKVPKFSFYKPNTLVVTSIEYDHADIYASIDEIRNQFDQLVGSMDKFGTVICCVDYEHVRDLSEKWKASAKARIVTYGEDKSADFRIISMLQEPTKQTVEVHGPNDEHFLFNLGIVGRFNAKNALAVILACRQLSLDLESIGPTLIGFHGVKRRQEVRFDGGVTLIEDFAHHPTAVRETLMAIKARYPGRKIWAVFEPRTQTSRKKVFQKDYVDAFGLCERAVICEVAQVGAEPDDLLDVKSLIKAISDSGVKAYALPNPDSIHDFLIKDVLAGELILVMSNGGFGGLIDKLAASLGTASLRGCP